MPRYGRLPQFEPTNVWFMRNDLVSIYHKSNAAGIVTLRNWTQDRLQTMTNKDFKRFRRRAYSISEAAKLLSRNPHYLSRQARAGVIPKPLGRGPGGIQIGTRPAYYSETTIFQIREILSHIHTGRPRKDGLITNNTIPTEAELRARVSDQLLVYVQKDDGQFVPTLDTYFS